jgi:hypothetical protein
MAAAWNATHKPLSDKVTRWILSKLEDMDFGDVKISVRAGKVVQINREEKERHNEVNPRM